jgi:K+-sensing histidine kinase KdpD
MDSQSAMILAFFMLAIGAMYLLYFIGIIVLVIAGGYFMVSYILVAMFSTGNIDPSQVLTLTVVLMVLHFSSYIWKKIKLSYSEYQKEEQ